MALAAALPELDVHGNDNSLSGRGEVLARYRQLREISERHHDEVMKLVSGDTMLHQARRLGLARGKTLILDDMDEMNYVFDLAIHTAPAGRSRRSTVMPGRLDLPHRRTRPSSLRPGAQRVSQFSPLSGATKRPDWSPPIWSAAPQSGWSTSGSKARCPRAG
jgi:hypothetical protein